MQQRYSEDHHWVRRKLGADMVTVGLSQFAQNELGEVAFLQLPEVGLHVERDQAVCAIESLKSAGEIYAPVTGVITAVNHQLRGGSGLELLNTDPLGRGWLFSMRMEQPHEFNELLSEDEYARRTAAGRE